MNDWLIFPNMGSFTFCATSDFNGFPMTSIIKIIDNKSYELLVNGKKQKYFQENDFDKSKIYFKNLFFLLAKDRDLGL